jgi:hypothetical protein
MWKVDRSQPAVPVNTSLLELYETALSLELKTDPWILFLYGYFRRACDASAHRGISVVVYSSTASIDERLQLSVPCFPSSGIFGIGRRGTSLVASSMMAKK